MSGHRTVLVVCKAGGESRTVTIKINTNNLVVCDEWNECPYHGGPDCEELGLHEEVMLRIAAKKGGVEGLLKHVLNEDIETFKRRMRRSFR